MHPNSAPPKLPARRARGAPHCSRSKGRPREGPLRGYSQKMCLGLSQGGRQGDGQQNSKQLGAELPARPHLVPGSRSARACPRVLTRVHGAGRLRPRVGGCERPRGAHGESGPRAPGLAREPSGGPHGAAVAWTRGFARAPAPRMVGSVGARSPGLGEGSEEEPRPAPGLRPTAYTPVLHTAKTPQHKHACGHVQLRHGARGTRWLPLPSKESSWGACPPLPGRLQDRPVGTLPPFHGVRPGTGVPSPFGGAAGVCSEEGPRLPGPQQP